MGSEKRERQKTARIAKIEQAEQDARRARRRRRAVQLTVAAVVIVGGLFLYSLLVGDDGDETAADGDTTSTTTPCPPEATAVSTSVPFSDPELATEVLDREPPCPEPPAEDTAADAVETETLIEGEGEGAANGQTVVLQYVGRLADGSVFDESWGRGQPFEVTLGEGGVIPGWEEGLIGAQVGERRRMVIGPEKAYGEQGQGEIPANAPLAFEVDVIDIRAGAPITPTLPVPTPGAAPAPGAAPVPGAAPMPGAAPAPGAPVPGAAPAPGAVPMPTPPAP